MKGYSQVLLIYALHTKADIVRIAGVCKDLHRRLYPLFKKDVRLFYWEKQWLRLGVQWFGLFLCDEPEYRLRLLGAVPEYIKFLYTELRDDDCDCDIFKYGYCDCTTVTERKSNFLFLVKYTDFKGKYGVTVTFNKCYTLSVVEDIEIDTDGYDLDYAELLALDRRVNPYYRD